MPRKKKEPHLCKKCKKDFEELWTMNNYMGYNKYFNEDDWFCRECFDKKLAKVNKEMTRENKQIYRGTSEQCDGW